MFGIRAKLLAFTALIILLISTALTSLSIIEHRNQMLERYRMEAIHLLTMVSETIIDDLYRLDIKDMSRHLNAMYMNKDISSVILLDSSGRILVDGTNDNLLRGQESKDLFLQNLKHANDTIIQIDRNFLKIGAPVSVIGALPMGWLAMIFDLNNLNQRLTSHLYTQLLVSAGFCLLGLGLAYLLAIKFTRPITTLTQVANRIRWGEMDVAIPIVGKNEILALSLALEQMVRQIRTSHEALQSMNISLDHKVEERTLELVQARKIAEDASRAKSDFLASMSHEIRTPMNAIIGLTDLAIQCDLSAKVRDYLLKSAHASRSLLRIINDILDFSKIEAGKMELEQNDFLLRDVFDHILDLFRARIAEKRLELILHIAHECRYALTGDALRLEQILMNLLGNAIKFTERGEIEISVETHAQNGNQLELLFSMRDTGIGLTQEQSAKLFAPFVQADGSTSRKYGGTGLGLSICKRLSELMGGRIWVESQAKEGSIFYFTAKFTRRYGPQEEVMILPEDLLHSRVLVVDDNPTICKALKTMCTGFHFEVSLAASGQEALELIGQGLREAHPFSLVLLDWWMPGLDGLETASEIKALIKPTDRSPKIILLTDHSQEEESQGAFVGQGDIQGVLVKPINCSLLFDGIMNVFGKDVAKVYKSGGQEVDASGVREKIGGACVLLVEDNPINQMIAREILQGIGLLVSCATDGRDAVNMVEQNRYDAVLMDVQMPVMDGYTATRLMRQNPQLTQLPIIAMTAHAMSGDREKSLTAGMNDHVTKPIDKKQLYDTLLRWISHENRKVPAPIEPKSKPGKTGLLPNMPGIDCTVALERLSGNESLFISLLLNFAEEFAPQVPLVKEILTKPGEERLLEIRQLLHAIKGIAGNLGARVLYEAVHALETAIQKQETARWPHLLQRFSSAFEQVLTSILSLQTEQGGVGEALQILVPIRPVEEVLLLLKNLAGLLAKNDVKSEATLALLKGFFVGTRLAELFNQLVAQVDVFDFDGAQTVLTDLQSQLLLDETK